MVRGVDRMDIFRDDEDHHRFLETLLRFKEPDNYELYAYCLMGNHVHLLIQEKESMSNHLMKRLGVSYVSYFNKKYKRVGHLFQDRYKSECIETEQYLLGCSRYIHNNPVKAGLVRFPEDYPWSSYPYYLDGIKNPLLNTKFILQHFSTNRKMAILRLKEFTKSNDQLTYLDEKMEEGTDQLKVINEILERYKISLEDLRVTKEIQWRNTILQEMKLGTCLSTRELSRILGISKDIIFRA